MSGTVDDFMRRFGGQGTMDDREAEQFHDRFVSRDPADSPFDNNTYHQSATEYLGKLPEQDFQRGARTAISQAPPEERRGLLGSLMATLGGGGLGGIAEKLGLKTTDPDQLSEDESARVLDYARRENPEALKKVVEEKPWFMKAMGNPVVQGALALAAAKMLANQRKGR